MLAVVEVAMPTWLSNPVNHPTIIRDPELAAVLAEIQRAQDSLVRALEMLDGRPVSSTLTEGKVEKGGLNVGPSQVVSRPPPPQSSYPIKRWWLR